MKSIQVYISALILVFSLPVHAQWTKKIKGNGNVVTENREVSSYDEIIVNGNIDVVLTDEIEGKIKLKAEGNLLEFIEVNVHKNVLKIKSKDRAELRPSKGKNILITVPVQDVQKLSLNGSGGIEGNRVLKNKKIILQLNGSGDIDVDVKATNVKAVINGSGNITISGKTFVFDARVSGSGAIDGNDLRANISKGKVVGSGNISFYAEEKLEAKIIGSGDIKVNETVGEIEKEIIGSGGVIKK